MNYEFKKEMIVKKVRADYSDLKQKAYKCLWGSFEGTGIFDLLEGKFKIVIKDDEISFDDGKTFINRREEKEIISEFDRIEKEVIRLVLEMAEECIEEISEENSKDKTDNNFDFEAIKSKLKDMTFNEMFYLAECLRCISVLDVIEEQIEVLREIGGDKEKLFELLEEKRKNANQLSDFVKKLKVSLNK